jgi:hypothetical protein
LPNTSEKSFPSTRRTPDRAGPTGQTPYQILVLTPPTDHYAGRCQLHPLKDQNGKPERGREWEPIKILLKGDRDSNKMNTTSNTRLRLNYPSWSRPRSHWGATNPRNQQTTFRTKTHQHARRKLARLAACATLLRPMASLQGFVTNATLLN